MRVRIDQPAIPGGYWNGAVSGDVSDPKRFADPGFEPTDEDLIGLSKRAFAHVRIDHENSLRKLRVDIAAARKAALERLRLRRPGAKAAG
jgi:hypothetical protein